MTGKRDYYDVLGLGRDADAATIKKAYRKLAIKYHPDRNQEPGAEDTFKEVSEAYAVLSDDDKRARYDRHGHAGIDQQYSTEDIFRNVDFQDIFGGMGGGFGNIFDMFFGGGSRGHGPSRGRDLQLTKRISLEDAYRGTEIEVEYMRLENCSHCSGNGAEPGSRVDTCGTCGGHGQVQRQQRTPFGIVSQVGACPTCGGSGKSIANPCKVCRGSGHERQKKRERVKIPAGIDDGMRMRVSGAGEVGGRGGPHGDLYIEVSVDQDKRFTREGADLVADLAITIPQAVLGAQGKLETFDGPIEVDIPAGTETGHVIRLRGNGMPYLRGTGNGDILVRIRVVTPKKLNDKTRKIFEDLADELGTHVESGKKGFFNFLKGN